MNMKVEKNKKINKKSDAKSLQTREANFLRVSGKVFPFVLKVTIDGTCDVSFVLSLVSSRETDLCVVVCRGTRKYTTLEF